MKYLNISLMLLLLSLSSCVRDGSEPCLGVTLNLHVEKFRNSSSTDPLFDAEANFCDRVEYLQYYLYNEAGALIRQNTLSNFSGHEQGCYPLVLDDLTGGKYTIVLIGNSSDNSLEGDDKEMNNLFVYYKGYGQTKDYFSRVYTFENDYALEQVYDVGMFRMHGVVRYLFKNVPSYVSAIEIEMDQLSNRKWIASEYEGNSSVLGKYDTSIVTTAEPEFLAGLFPTLPDHKSTYQVHLYKAGETTPFLSHLVTDDVKVVRNQLLSIEVAFHNGLVGFDVSLDNSWDGASSGSETELD